MFPPNCVSSSRDQPRSTINIILGVEEFGDAESSCGGGFKGHQTHSPCGAYGVRAICVFIDYDGFYQAQFNAIPLASLHVFRDLRSDNSRFVVQRAAKAHKAGVDVLEQLRGLWNILGTKPSVCGAIFSSFQAERQSNHKDLWSGRWESNPRPKLGKLLYCHCTTPALLSSLLIIPN